MAADVSSVFKAAYCGWRPSQLLEAPPAAVGAAPAGSGAGRPCRRPMDSRPTSCWVIDARFQHIRARTRHAPYSRAYINAQHTRVHNHHTVSHYQHIQHTQHTQHTVSWQESGTDSSTRRGGDHKLTRPHEPWPMRRRRPGRAWARTDCSWKGTASRLSCRRLRAARTCAGLSCTPTRPWSRTDT